MADASISYVAHPTLASFHADNSRIRCVIGHVGSGKTTAMCMEALLRGIKQEPSKDGIRRTKGAVIRRNYRELKTTTISTWLGVFPEKKFGRMVYDSPIRQLMEFEVAKEPVQIEVLFFPIDEPKDIEALKSLELTWFYVNEAAEITIDALNMLTTRWNRYPKFNEHGVDPTWYGGWMDSNPPNPDHWLFKHAEESTPIGWHFFKQPPALIRDIAGPVVSLEGTRWNLNHGMENIRWNPKDPLQHGLTQDYFIDSFQGKSDDFINVYGAGQYGFLKEGKPVYSAYNDRIHYTDNDLPLIPGVPIEMGFDFGGDTSCVLTQFHKPTGQLRIIDEIFGEGKYIEDFIPQLLLPHLAQYYAGASFRAWGDPAGNNPGGATARTCFQMLREGGINAFPAPLEKNDILPRVNAVTRFLGRLAGQGQPAFLLGPKCKMLHAGFLGKYFYVKRQSAAGGYQDTPCKNEYSHLQDALQYLCLGILGPIGASTFDVGVLISQSGHTVVESAAGY